MCSWCDDISIAVYQVLINNSVDSSQLGLVRKRSNRQQNRGFICRSLSEQGSIVYLIMRVRIFLASLVSMFVAFSICSQSTPSAANQTKPFLNKYFTQDEYRELAVAKVGSFLVKGTFNCLFRCVGEPQCLSVNLAAHPHSGGLYQCDLLATDKYGATAKDFQASDAFHRYSPWVNFKNRSDLENIRERIVVALNTMKQSQCILIFAE